MGLKVKTAEKAAVPMVGNYQIERAATARGGVRPGDFEGAESARRGIRGLVIADEVTMIAVPDLITAARKADGTVDLDMWKSVQTSLIAHCQGQANRMAILDAPPNMDPQQIKEWRSGGAPYHSKIAPPSLPFVQRWETPGPTTGPRPNH